MVLLLEGKPVFCFTTKVLLADWFPETTLYLFAPSLFLKSLSWLQIWCEVSQRACPQPPMGLADLACTLQVAWRELQGVGDGHGKEMLTKRAWGVSQQLPTACWSRLSEASDKSLQNTKQVIKTSVQVFPNLTESQKLSLDTNRNFPLWCFIN